MWALLLPLPWFLAGLLAAGMWRRGKPGCVFFAGIFVWPQARLLAALGIGIAEAWVLSLAVMAICPIVGYLVGLRLFPPDGKGGPSQP
jgi:hypothetical protein